LKIIKQHFDLGSRYLESMMGYASFGKHIKYILMLFRTRRIPLHHIFVGEFEAVTKLKVEGNDEFYYHSSSRKIDEFNVFIK